MPRQQRWRGTVQSTKGTKLMSRTVSAPGWGSRAALIGVSALVLAVLAVVSLASQANAAFTTPKCEGEKILGRGASFAQAAHGAWEIPFRTVYCGGIGPDIEYDPAGSGAGINGMKLRGAADPHFGGTDDPLKTAQKNEINAGTVAEGDEGLIHQIPIAVGAVAPLVNFPDGCDVNDLPAGSKTPFQDLDIDAVDDDVIRVRFSKEQWEKVWAQNEVPVPGGSAPYITWRQVFPTLDDEAACKKPVIRVVRFDNSGTTFAFKDYLHRINGARGWLSTFESGANGNREWPGATFGPRTDCAGTPNGPGGGATQETDNLTSGCSNGNGSLVAKLIATDGSIGYSDVATARSNNMAITPEANDNDTYWTQLENGKNEFKEPTFDETKGFRTDGQRGANCTETEFKNVSASTLDEWGSVSGVNSEKGYGLCTLTYGMAWDDYADPYSALPAALEEQRARSVKDYFEFITTEGQSLLFANDYASLPTSPVNVLAISKAGAAAIGWDKSAGGGGGGGGGGGAIGGTGGGTTPLPVVKPPNNFTLPKKSISSKTGGVTISVKLPGPGVLEMVGTAKVGKKQINVGRTVLNASKAGTFALQLKPSGAAKQQLRKKGSLKVSLELTFTPTGGDENSSTTSIMLKLKKGK
jgi:ABC-type phosphate transport system substrate-binding protein